MQPCETFQAQLLEHLYDLLEGQERQALADHLAACQPCRDALERTRRQQTLLAAAARMEFPDVRFTAPQTSEAAPTVAPLSGQAPATLPMPTRPAKPKRHWRRWAVAAAVLAVLGGLAVPGTRYGREYLQARDVVRQKQAALAQARLQSEEAQKGLVKIAKEREDNKQQIIHDAKEKQLTVAVTGKPTLQGGAPADYRIETRDLNHNPAQAVVSIQVMDGQTPLGKPIEAKPLALGQYRVTLPPDLPVRPGSQPTLVVSAKRDGGTEAEVRESLSLTAPVYLTHLATDKPMYLPGETVHFRSLTLDRASMRPAQEPFRLAYTFTMPKGEQAAAIQGLSLLVKETGEPIKGPDGVPLRGLGAGEWRLPSDAPGGEWTLTVREEQNRFPEQRRKFVVNRYQKPRLNKELDYSRTTYGPGDPVIARCKVSEAGRPLRSCPVTAQVQIDGQTYDANGNPSAQLLSFQTDAEGVVDVRFKLPEKIDRGLASLTVTFQDEPLQKPIPIVVKKLQVEIYPEGGYLVAGLPNRVYFQVRTPLGKPAELTGRLLEDGKPIDVAVETLHDDKEPGVNQGMGKFSFTPRAKKTYEIEVEKPVGVSQRFALPAAEEGRVALSVPGGVFAAADPIPVLVHSAAKKSLLVGAYCRGRLLDTAQVEPGSFDVQNTAKVTLRPEAGVGGVCRVTVFEVQGEGGARRVLQPVAERLVYRQPAERLDLKVETDRQAYVPRQNVKLGLSATNEKGEKAPAIVMLAVVDKSVLALADEKTARSMPTHFLLTTEVRRPEDLEYADFLLGTHARAAESLDLLLGTQGWRRFAEQDPGKFRHEQKEEAERYVMSIGQSADRTTDFVRDKLAAVDRTCDEKVADLTEKAAEARETDKATRDDPAYHAALATLLDYENFFDKMGRIGPALAGLVLAVLLVIVLAVMASRRPAIAPACYAAALLCLIGGGVLLKFEMNQVAALRDAKQKSVAAFVPAPPLADVAPNAAQHGGDAKGAVREDERVNAERGEGGRGGFPLPPGPAPGGGPGGPFAPPPRPAPVPVPAGLPFDDKAPRERPDVDALNAMLKGENKQADGKAKEMLEARQLQDMMKGDFGAEFAAKKAFEQAGGRGAAGRMAPGRAKGGLWQDQLRRARDMKDRAEGLAPLEPLVVREYAHKAIAVAKPGQRNDWTETVCWYPALVLSGDKTDVAFQLSDNVTTFQATVFAHTLDGRIGAVTHKIESRLPIALRPKVPFEVTAGDRIDLPVSLTNNSDQARNVRLELTAHDRLQLEKGEANVDVGVGAEAVARRLWSFRPQGQEGEASVAIEARTGGVVDDSVKHSFRIVPMGFPFTGTHSDVLESSATKAIELPETWVKGTLQCRVNVYPSTLAELQSGLDGLLREPGGCFEQTSTSNYPNVLILDYLKESNQAKPEVERRARDLLARGYGMLTSFECLDTAKNAKRGYEWFGGTAPAHEALTAYGLMEFRDMARVHDVDPVMVQRTREYLLARKDGKGGFERNPRALDSFGGAPQDITNAYIVWAITEGGKDDDVAKELDALVKKGEGSKDPYFLSLVANSLINKARTPEGTKLLKKVVEAQKDDGHLDAESTSITRSGGRDLQIETTALAVLGWLKANPGEFQQAVSKAVKWIGQQRGGYGGFGSTQSTILALKALIAYTKANKKTAEAGTLQLFVGDKLAGRMEFPAGAAEVLSLPVADAETLLRPGKNKVRIEITGKNVFPYTLAWSYRTEQPASADKCAVRLETSLAKTEVKEGDGVRLTVKVSNVTREGQGMAVAIIGLPGGMNLPEDLKQLKEHARVPEDGSRPLIGAFEVRGRELVLYWRDLAPEQKIEVPVDLVCRVPGEYSGPASRAYLYYNADHKHWVAPIKVAITPKE